MQNTSLKAPFGWVGGKSKLAKDIIGLIPEHKTYIEVFSGAASVLYQKEASKLEILNDINNELINLHLAIRNHPQTLSVYLNQLLISKELFNQIRDKKIKPRNKIEAAAFYLYLIDFSFGAKKTNFAMSAKTGKKPKNIYKSYQVFSNRLKGVSIENKSFQELIPLYDKPDSFFYLDPPYVKTEKYYQNIGEFGIKEHKQLSSILYNIKGKFLLSYNDCEEVRELYKNFNIQNTKEIRYTLGSNVHKKDKKVQEIFITNY